MGKKSHKKHKKHKHKHKKRSSSSSSSRSASPRAASPIGRVLPQPIGPEIPDFIAARIATAAAPQPIGPEIPDFIAARIASQQPEASASAANEEEPKKKRRFGPTLPPPSVDLASLVSAGAVQMPQEDIDDDEVGPRPEGAPLHRAFYSAEARRREELLARGLSNEDDGKQRREEWMTMVPEERKTRKMDSLSRTFSMKEATNRGDTSIWTDTPADRLRKAKERAMGVVGSTPAPSTDSSVVPLSARDEATADLVEKYNSLVRPERLLEIHAKETSKLKEPAIVEKGIRHFDREKDLIQRTIDPKKANEMIHKARELNDRFSRGAK